MPKPSSCHARQPGVLSASYMYSLISSSTCEGKWPSSP